MIPLFSLIDCITQENRLPLKGCCVPLTVFYHPVKAILNWILILLVIVKGLYIIDFMHIFHTRQYLPWFVENALDKLHLVLNHSHKPVSKNVVKYNVYWSALHAYLARRGRQHYNYNALFCKHMSLSHLQNFLKKVKLTPNILVVSLSIKRKSNLPNQESNKKILEEKIKVCPELDLPIYV